MEDRVSVIGAGAWGSAFSIHLTRRKKKVLLWVFEPELLDILKRTRENAYYLRDFRLPEGIDFTNDLKEACSYSRDLVIAVPSFAFRDILEKMKEWIKGKRMLILTKGLDAKTFKRMSEIALEVSGGINLEVAVLSGPSFAKEVAQGLFTSAVVASESIETSRYFQDMIHGPDFRIYTSADVIGVEIGGALKNVMAIGAGIIQGLGLGNNTLSAYITRALAEMKRFGKAFGAKEVTFLGLSGVGDLVLTSFGPLSRNRSFGYEIAKGKSPKELILSSRGVVEGFYTLEAAYNLSRMKGIYMPITSEIYRIIYEGKSISESLWDLTRTKGKEEEE